MNTLSATTIRTALIDYRAEMLRLANAHPNVYHTVYRKVVKEIDDVLLSIEGNITSVIVTPATCNPSR